MVRVSVFEVEDSNRCVSGGSNHVIRVVTEFFDMVTGLPCRIEYHEIPHRIFSKMKLKTSFTITKSSFNEIDDWVSMPIGIVNLSRISYYELVTEAKEILSIVNVLNKIRSDTLPNSLVGSRSMILDGVYVNGQMGTVHGINLNTGSILVCVQGSYFSAHFSEVKFFTKGVY